MNGVDVGLVGHGAAGTDGVGRTQVFKGRHCVNVFLDVLLWYLSLGAHHCICMVLVYS